MYIKSYKDLIVWQKSMALVKEIYILSSHFPKSEVYGITSQMRRAAISIPSNIAEGYGRKSTKTYAQFCAIAFGSALELETQLIIAEELQLASKEEFRKVKSILVEVCKMLNTMLSKIRDTNN
jgi:four helix bundle protein